MKTPRIEEMMREFERFTIMDGNRILLHGEAERAETWLHQALTEAHQAGIDEAVALLKEKRNGHCGKKDCLQAYCINRKIIKEFCDDTIKALQDNK